MTSLLETRLGLHAMLCGILSSFDTWLWDPFKLTVDTLYDEIEVESKRHVYFQPPEKAILAYPCIVYELSGIKTHYADDKPYAHKRKYTVTVIDKNPDSEIPKKLGALPLCSFDRFFTTANLNHFVFSIYY